MRNIKSFFVKNIKQIKGCVSIIDSFPIKKHCHQAVEKEKSILNMNFLHILAKFIEIRRNFSQIKKDTHEYFIDRRFFR